MDLREYYRDLHKVEAKLEHDHPDGIVHVTSLFHREKNSTPGSTLSATCRNAARVITDGTHREASEEEIRAFLRHQSDQLRTNTANEQRNRRQYIVVVDQKDRAETAVFDQVGLDNKDTAKASPAPAPAVRAPAASTK